MSTPTHEHLCSLGLQAESSQSEPELWEFYVEWGRALERREHSLRKGQLAFTVLENMRPDLAERVRTTAVDPFYDDTRLPAFFTFIGERWS